MSPRREAGTALARCPARVMARSGLRPASGLLCRLGELSLTIEGKLGDHEPDPTQEDGRDDPEPRAERGQERHHGPGDNDAPGPEVALSPTCQPIKHIKPEV